MTALPHEVSAAAAHRHDSTDSCSSPRFAAWPPQFCPSYSNVAPPGGDGGTDGGDGGGDGGDGGGLGGGGLGGGGLGGGGLGGGGKGGGIGHGPIASEASQSLSPLSKHNRQTFELAETV